MALARAHIASLQKLRAETLQLAEVGCAAITNARQGIYKPCNGLPRL
jgi:hypothetical protein